MNGAETVYEEERRESCEPIEEEYVEEYLDEVQESRTNYVDSMAQKDRLASMKKIIKQAVDTRQKPFNKFKLSPTLNSLHNIKNDRILSEIQYLKSKTQFYAQEKHKLHTQRTLMLLEIKKTCLEIEHLEKEEN